MKKIYLNKKGFTLIELLVVITIIGILAGIIIVSMAGAAVKSRDSRRKADLDAMKKAVSMYAVDKGNYPTREAMCNETASDAYNTAWTNLQTDLMKYLSEGNLPQDPRGLCHGTHTETLPGSGASSDKHNYLYLSGDKTKYSIWTALENTKDTDNNAGGVTTGFSANSGKFINTYRYSEVGNSTTTKNSANLYGVGTAQ